MLCCGLMKCEFLELVPIALVSCCIFFLFLSWESKAVGFFFLYEEFKFVVPKKMAPYIPGIPSAAPLAQWSVIPPFPLSLICRDKSQYRMHLVYKLCHIGKDV